MYRIKPNGVMTISAVAVLLMVTSAYVAAPVGETDASAPWEFKQGDVRGFEAEFRTADIEKMIDEKYKNKVGATTDNRALALFMFDDIIDGIGGDKTVNSMSAEGYVLIAAVVDVISVRDTAVDLNISAKAVANITANASIHGRFPPAGEIDNRKSVMGDCSGNPDARSRTVDIAVGVFVKASIDAKVTMTTDTYAIKSMAVVGDLNIGYDYEGDIKLVHPGGDARHTNLSYGRNSTSSSIDVTADINVAFDGGLNIFNGLRDGKWICDTQIHAEKMKFGIAAKRGGAILDNFQNKVGAMIAPLRFMVVDKSNNPDEFIGDLELENYFNGRDVTVAGESRREADGSLAIENRLSFPSDGDGIRDAKIKEFGLKFVVVAGGSIPIYDFDMSHGKYISTLGTQFKNKVMNNFDTIVGQDAKALKDLMGKMDGTTAADPNESPTSPLMTDSDEPDKGDDADAVRQRVALIAGICCISAAAVIVLWRRSV